MALAARETQEPSSTIRPTKMQGAGKPWSERRFSHCFLVQIPEVSRSHDAEGLEIFRLKPFHTEIAGERTLKCLPYQMR